MCNHLTAKACLLHSKLWHILSRTDR